MATITRKPDEVSGTNSLDQVWRVTCSCGYEDKTTKPHLLSLYHSTQFHGRQATIIGAQQ